MISATLGCNTAAKLYYVLCDSYLRRRRDTHIKYIATPPPPPAANVCPRGPLTDLFYHDPYRHIGYRKTNSASVYFGFLQACSRLLCTVQ